jgi:hypothetical protein
MPTVEQIQAATQEFITNTPEMGAYLTEENIKQIAAYVQGAFPHAVASASAYEVAFKDLLASKKLKRISGYVAPLTEEQRARVRNTPGYIASDLYKNDPEFKRLFDAIAQEEKDRQDLLQWARVYQTMDPTEAARRYVEEPGFSDAVQELIDAGLI